MRTNPNSIPAAWCAVARCAFFAAPLIGLLGCQSVERRVAADPEAFAALAPEVQERVRAGEVDVGFSRRAVRFALGEPDQVGQVRREGEGTREVWTFLRLDVDALPVHGSYRGSGRYYDGGLIVHGPSHRAREVVEVVVEFEGDRAVAVLYPERPPAAAGAAD